MLLFSLTFSNFITFALLASFLVVGCRLVLWLARLSENLIALMARLSMYRLGRALLVGLISYDERTYQASETRLNLWNQVYFRFVLLWGLTLLGIVFVLFFRIQAIFWVPVVGGLIAYRLYTLLTTTHQPVISSQDPELSDLLQDVNEPSRPRPRGGRPIIRQVDYLDELFAEAV